VYFFDCVGTGYEQVLVATFKAQTAEVVEAQVLHLKVRTHCAIEDDDSFF
jgi:hypothetical protein